MKQVIDNFSTGSDDYAAFRPQSPEAIYDFLFRHVHNYNTAWDCGTGNGQVAVTLSERFSKVYGTDISQQQLANATHRDNIFYLQERAEQTSLADTSVDLITVAQAIHWFDFDSFYREVKRVATQDALIAAWTYNVLRVTPAVNKVIDHLYHDITRPYWDPERKYVDEQYATIPFPFKEVFAPPIEISLYRDVNWLIGYLGTWSGAKNYIKATGNDPVAMVRYDIVAAWGDSELHEINFPVHVRAGFVHQ
jgi:hypothetical protein